MNELMIGELYKIKYINVMYDQTFQLIKKNITNKRHEISYIFLDQNNNIKTMFTNSLINDGKIIFIPIEKKDYITIEIANIPNVNPIIFSNRNAYLSTILDDHDIYG